MACAALLMPVAPTAAADAPAVPATPEQRAGDEAFHQFVDKVLTLRLGDGRISVAQMITLPVSAGAAGGLDLSATIERDLRTALLTQHQRGAPRPTAGGGVEVDAWLPASRVGEIIIAVAAAHLPQVDRARIALSPTTGPSITATGRYLPDGRPRDNRPGWRHCTADQIAQTRAAADLDLRRHLMNRVGDFQMPGGERLRVILAHYPRFRDALTRRIARLPAQEPVFEPTGVCRLALSVSLEALYAELQAAASESKEPLPAGAVRAFDPISRNPLVAEGFALPPPESPPLPAPRAKAPVDPGRPAWTERFVTAQATGHPPPNTADARARRDLATRAARLEATRTLWQEIEKLPIASGTVGDRIEGHPRAREAVASIEALIIPVSDPAYAEDGSATLTLGIPLDRVWRIVRELR